MDLFTDNSKIDSRDLFSDSQTSIRIKNSLTTESETEITSETAQYQDLSQIATQEPIILEEGWTDPETETEIIPEILTELTLSETIQYPEMEKSVPQQTEGPEPQQTEGPETKTEVQIITITELQEVQGQEKENTEPETIPPQLIEAVLEIRENLVQLREGVLSGDETTVETVEIETEGITETEITLSDIKESMELGFLDIQTGIEIIAKDQQIIGKVSIASQLILIGVFVVYLFFGRIR